MKRADAKDIHVADMVILKAEERLTLTSCWAPQWGGGVGSCSNRWRQHPYAATTTVRPPPPPEGLACVDQEKGEPSQATPIVQPLQGKTHPPPATDFDIPLSPGSQTPSTDSGNSVASGPTSVIMDSPQQDTPSPCGLILIR